jgi:predicted MFS family arabinose efflux permease
MLRKVTPLRSRLSESFTTFGAVFKNPNIRRVQLAWAATMLGQWAYYVALSVFAYKAGGAAAVGLVGLIRAIPSAIAAPFSSMLSDRYPRERVLLVAQIGRMVVLSASAAALFADVPSGVIYAAAGAMTVLGEAMKPAQAALLPSLATTPQELTAANVAFRSIQAMGLFIGPAIGGILLAFTEEGVVFAAAAVASAAAAIVVARIRPEAGAERKAAGERRGFLDELSAGFRTIGADRRLQILVLLSVVQFSVAGAFSVLVVASALDLLDLGESGVGLLNSAVGIGALLGTLVAITLVGRERLASDLGIGIFLWGIPIMLIGIWPKSIVAFALLLFVGAGNTLIDVSGPTLLQRLVEDEVLARVFGALQSLLIAGYGVGMIGAPLLIEFIGIRGALIVSGALLPVLTTLFWRSLTRIDPGVKAPAAILELLRSDSIFASLPEPALEYLAGKVTPVKRQAGEVVFQQGEHGDRYYLVGDGEVEVTVDGRAVGTLGPGKGFGEIALLRDVPRTATVTAKTDVALYAIERDDFLAAVTGHQASAQAADSVITTRLGTARPEVATL